MLSSQEKYTISFIDTSFPENSSKMGQNMISYKKDDEEGVSSIISNDITISLKAIEDRTEKKEMSDIDYTAGILAHEWGHGTVSNLLLEGNKQEADADIPKNELFKELSMINLPKLTWKPEETAH